MTHRELLDWLHETDDERLETLYRQADRARQANVGDEVHLRGLIEISSFCRRSCLYCGLRLQNRKLVRYRMTPEETLDCARQAAAYGYGTVVLQSGEDPQWTRESVAELVCSIKDETGLAVTLSLGERSDEDLAAWREAGADRYLLRFETSDSTLYDRIHPGARGGRDRFEMLKALKSFGYETGSGVMVGIPGQSLASLAADLLYFRQLDLDMIGIGPYLRHPDTPLGHSTDRAEEQVPSIERMVYKTIALTRLLRPDANIPATTALATMNPRDGRELGLLRGANVVMPNLTPHRFRALYEIYPGKACVGETAEACNGCLRHRIESLGRVVGQGPGGRRSKVTLCA